MSKTKKIDPEKLVAELKKRTAAKSFNLKEYCFPEQYNFVKDPARFKVARCSRRAGKTVGIAADFIDTCTAEKNVICLYITLTSTSARSIIWGDLKRIIEEEGFNVKTDETRLQITFLDTKSQIRLGGAKDEVEIEKYRGWKLRKCYIDEAQSFRPYLTYFIYDIIMPALRDLRGELGITGTPGPVLAGPYYEIDHSENWSKHHWTAFDNPHMLDLDQTLEEERLVKGITEEDPGYRRETFGEWVKDDDSLVYKFNKALNTAHDIPKQNMEYIFGVDIGWNDSDAIAVLGYNHDEKKVYLVDEFIKDKQTITELMKQVAIMQKKYNPVKMVMDAGALGKKIQEEIRSRHTMNFEAAEKHRKHEFIELLNDDLRTGKLMSYPDSRFEQDTSLVTWERTAGGKRKISDAYHTDIGDAVLYAWRECKHYFFEAVPKKPRKDTDEWMNLQEEREAQAMEDAKWRSELEPDYDLNEDIDDDGFY